MRYTLKVPSLLPTRNNKMIYDFYNVKHDIEIEELSMRETSPVFADEPDRVRFVDGKFFEVMSESMAPFKIRTQLMSLYEGGIENILPYIILYANNGKEFHSGILHVLYNKCREKANSGHFVHKIDGFGQGSEELYSRLQGRIMKQRGVQYKNLTEDQKKSYDGWMDEIKDSLRANIMIDGKLYKRVHPPKISLSFALSAYGNSYSVALAESGGYNRRLGAFILDQDELQEEIYKTHIPVGDQTAQDALLGHVARRFGIEFNRSYVHVNLQPFDIEGYAQETEISEMRWLALLTLTYLQLQFVENLGRGSVTMTKEERETLRNDVAKARSVIALLREAQKSTDKVTLLSALCEGVEMIDRVIEGYCTPYFKGDIIIKSIEVQGKMIAAQCERFTLEPIPIHEIKM